MVQWHHLLNGHEFEQAPRVGEGQGSLVCCSPWGRKESDTTEQLNWTELIHRKALNSLTWVICFVLFFFFLSLTVIFWCVLSSWSLLQNLLHTLTPPHCLFGAVSWDAMSWVWSPQKVCQIRRNSQLLGYALFLDNSFVNQAGHTSLLCLNSLGIQNPDRAEASCARPPPQSPDESGSLLAPGSPVNGWWLWVSFGSI